MSDLSEGMKLVIRLRAWADDLNRMFPNSEEAADLLAAASAIEAGEWREWPSVGGSGEYPPDETQVLVYCGNWESKDFLLGCINRRCGTYGPSGASHWRFLPAPPEVTR